MSVYKRSLQVIACVLVICCLLAQSAQAHFIWVYQSDDKIKVVFGEGLEPDQAQFLGGLKSMKAYRWSDGKRQLVEFSREEADGLGWFEHSVDKVGLTVDVHCQYGVFSRGETSMLLDYGAKYVNLAASQASSPGDELKLDLVPELENGSLKLMAYFEGKPVDGVELNVTREATDQSVQTDESGKASVDVGSRYVIRGKYTVNQGGSFNGEKYDEQRYYCTLVVDGSLPQATQTSSVDNPQNRVLKRIDAQLANFPKGLTSFGADVVDGKIYVVGGKSGRAHSYAKSYQNRNLFCLSTGGGEKAWSTASENHGLQGLAAVGYKGKLYRIGGLEARNKEDEDQDLHSVADVKSFDPLTKKWSDLPSLPDARSSHDACVAGDHVYVVGGWTMGDGESKWATEMLRFDLSKPDSKWESIEVPFRTRALAVECWKNQIVVVGGIKQAGGPTNETHIYDIATGQWKVGPEVATEGQMKSFGCSCVTLKDRLFVSIYDGGVYELNSDVDGWSKVFQLEDGRFFHQMVPIGTDRFAIIGGSHMETGSHFAVEAFEVVE